MATGGTSEKNDEDFRYACTLCMEPYRGRSPKILPCFHTFCLPCLTALEASVTMATSEAREGEGGKEEKTDDGEEHADSQAEERGEQPASGSVTQDGRKEADSPAGNQTGRTFLCPTCRAPVTIPEGGMASLQNNFYVAHEINEEETLPPALCSMCDEGREEPATYTCQDCPSHMCRTCRRYHDKFMASHHVTAVSLGQPQGQEKKEERKVLCPVHRDQVLCFHCRQCQMNICLHCKVSSHEGHDTVELARAVVEAKEQLTSLVTEAQQQMHVMQSSLKRAERKERQLTRHVQEVTQKVHARHDHLVMWSQTSRDRVLEVLSCKEDAERIQLQEEKSTITTATNMLSSLISRAAAQPAGNDTDVMMLRNELKAALLSDDKLERHQQHVEDNDVTWSWRYDDAGSDSILQACDVQAYMGSLKDGSATDDITARVSLQELTAKVTTLMKKEADLEDEMRSLADNMQKNQSGLQEGMTSLTQEVQSLQKNEAQTQAAVQLLTSRIGNTVSFFAKGIDRDSSKVTGRLVFKDVTVNEGDGYSNTTGVFTIPVPGIYVFSAVVGCNTSPYNVVANLIVNSTRYARLEGSSSSTGSASVCVWLKAGDTVWVETPSGSKHDYEKTRFTGTLLLSQA